MDRALLYRLQTGLDSLFENELCDEGAVMCVIDGKDLMYWISKLRKRHQGTLDTSTVRDSHERGEKIIKITNDNGWKHKIYTEEYFIDVTDVFDEK